MYRYSNGQISLSDFQQPIGMHLRENNRWVKKAQSIPWDKIEEKYADLFPSETGNVAKPLQLALGACLIQAIGEIVMKSTVALSNFPISASWLQRRSCLTSGMRKISPAIPSD